MEKAYKLHYRMSALYDSKLSYTQYMQQGRLTVVIDHTESIFTAKLITGKRSENTSGKS
ncbi:hypothetical protein [Xanthocytophaga flava]|uniref:hypothetical protein n=1 Tax=Xanthocytophaga flava TaxID=3048013 RepID=UPI0028D3F8DE|nr:hypothetical protein [Xanthocytophaga flavus]MDJ1470300.1 hypothetical protein [Xanthocytophaga flavus]